MSFLSILRTWQIPIALLVGLIAIYRYYLKRPNLVFTISPTSGELDAGDTDLFRFTVENNGRKIADDPFVQVEFENWYPKRIAEEEVYEVFQFGVDVATYEYPNKMMQQAWENSGTSSDSLTIRYFINNPIPQATEHPIDTMILELNREKEYVIEYKITCRSQQPFPGEIILKVDTDGTIKITESHMGRLRRFFWGLPFAYYLPTSPFSMD